MTKSDYQLRHLEATVGMPCRHWPAGDPGIGRGSFLNRQALCQQNFGCMLPSGFVSRASTAHIDSRRLLITGSFYHGSRRFLNSAAHHFVFMFLHAYSFADAAVCGYLGVRSSSTLAVW